MAILSREPAEQVSLGFADGDDESDARLIAATIRDIRIISVYVPNGQSVGSDKYIYKLAWISRLRAYLDSRCSAGQPVVLCGDFNVAPEDRDIYDPTGMAGQILCSDAERAALVNVLEWGLLDAFRLHHPEPGLYSWWDYRQLAFPKNRGMRIDMVYVSAPLVPRCMAASIDRQARKGKGASDHAPVLVELAE